MPPTPPAKHVVPQCSIDFNNDKQHPTRVTNEAKACLDEVAITLGQNTDNNLVIVGEAGGVGGESVAAAAQRAVNTKNYLATEKGIDPARIIVVTGTENTGAVEEYLVPPGATFTSDVPNTTPVDESVVKPQVREPLTTRSHATPKPAAATAPAGSTKPATTTKKPVTHKKKSAGTKKPAAGTAPAAGWWPPAHATGSLRHRC